MIDPWFIIGWAIIAGSVILTMLKIYPYLVKLKDKVVLYLLWIGQKKLRDDLPKAGDVWRSYKSLDTTWDITSGDPLRMGINGVWNSRPSSEDNWKKLVAKWRLVRVTKQEEGLTTGDQ